MPIVPVETRSGLVNFNCTISTPTKTEADAIELGLPTIVFMHNVYLPQISFHSQFVDPMLRKFNLVTFDFRSHGETTGAKVPAGYDQEEMTDDVLRLLHELNIPEQFHIMALSLGTVVALEIATRYPQRCLSLLLVGALGAPEQTGQEAVILREMHQDVHVAWKQGYPDKQTVLEDVLKDAFYGGMQLGFSGLQSAFGDACLAIGFNYAEHHWTIDNLDEFRYTTLDLYHNRRGFSKSQLSRIRCPIRLFKGEADMAHSPEFAQKFAETLREAGCDAELTFVPKAPHLVNIDHAEYINPVLHDLVMAQTSEEIPDAPTPVFSPWTPLLKDAGWIPEGDDEDEDGFIIHYQGF
ncbi:alpha/beta-hydrolase [Dendrothele bispora CBS 962.96]|uniref:Alpha/beta-hydrolase n=1 Tax=Dendrothele bispora (strain CBS 962.96) TaxID=1314807 RepID=A0A4S8M430_DENBC|nr:alpha/beta-hydrolase [Dendrothele bispora CBS 962.96]